MSSSPSDLAIHRVVLSLVLGSILGLWPSVSPSLGESTRAQVVSAQSGDRALVAAGQDAAPVARKAPAPWVPVSGIADAVGKPADVEIASLDWLGSAVDGRKAGVSRIGRGRAPPRVG